MERSGSFSSQGSGTSGFSGDSRVSTGGGEGKDKQQSGEQDLLEQQQSIAAGVFGVLFTLSKEKVDSSRKFAVAKIVLDYIQLLVLVVHPSFGWKIDENLWLWKVIEAVNLKNPIISKGYTFYIAILYLVASILVMSILLCIWVGWCFKNQRFPFVWPIKVLRLFVSVFFQVFYIAALGVFLVACDCHWLGDDDPTVLYPRGYMQAFNEAHIKCTSMPHLAHLFVSIVLIIVFIIVALTITAADFELNPLSRRWLAAASSTVELRAVVIRTIATLAFALLDDMRKLQALIICSCMTLMCWSFIRWEPHLYQWSNHVRAGLYGSLMFASMCLCTLVYRMPQLSESAGADFSRSLSTVMLAGLAPVWLLFMFISWLRYRYTMNKALEAVQNMQPGQNLREVYRWPDVETVEMAARVCRKWNPEDDEELDPEAVKTAEIIMKGGMAFFSTNPQMVLLYSSFLIEVTGAYQSGHSQLGTAKGLSPNYTQQFIIFVREQMHMQRSQTQASGETSVDLVSYVEFQRNYRLLVSCHRGALLATRSFWRLLLHSDVSFTALARAFNAIETGQMRAEKMYKNVLERYPSSSKILRLYARFLEEVKNDPWTAAQFYGESEKMEEQQADQSIMTKEGDEKGGGVDERNNPVCVINATGTIQMVNKVLVEMWGYKRDELNGKNVSMLMPNPFSNKHNTFLRNYISTGKVKILDMQREVLALHKDKYCFPIKLNVTKVSGEGADSVFMGVFKEYDTDPSMVRAYCSTTGILLTCDARFVDWFGKTVNECVGHSFGSLTMDAGAVDQALMRAAEMTEAELATGQLQLELALVHKFSDPVHCVVTITMGGTEAQRLLVMSIRRKVAADLMMCCDSHGRILYITTALANFLNYEPKELVRNNLSILLAPPFNVLHSKYMRNPPAKVPLNSCRGNFTVTMVPKGKPSVPVRCKIDQREINEVQVYVVQVESSSFDAGVDERRLRLALDPEQSFQTAKEIVGHPRNVFGQRPAVYLGMHLSCYIDAFRVMREADPNCDASAAAPLVLELIRKAREVPGCSFRCGVHPPVQEDRFVDFKRLSAAAVAHEAAAAKAEEAGQEPPLAPAELRKFMMERQLLQRETRSVRMQVNIKEPEENANGEPEGEPQVILELTQAEAITAIMELDGKGKIVKAGCCPLHMGGIIFGISNAALLNHNIREFLILPPKSRPIQYLMTDDSSKKKSALKGAHELKKLGPVKMLEMRHADGNSAKLLGQCLQKDGVSNRYILRCQVHKPVVNIKNFLETVKRVSAANKLGAGAGGEDWLGRDEDDDDDDDEAGPGAGKPSAGMPRMASVRRGTPPPKEKVKAAPMVGDDDDAAEAVREKDSGDLLGDLPDGPGNDSGRPMRGSYSGRGQAQLPHSASKDLEDGDASGKGTARRRPNAHNNDSARPSGEFGPNGAPALAGADKAGGIKKPVAPAAAVATGKARRASFQLAEGQDDDDDKPRKRAASPKGRKDADGPAGVGAMIVAGGVPAGDNMSDKSSESGVSASDISASVSQAGGVAAAGATGDYRRGKRYKKLQQLLSSKQNQATLNAFQIQSAIVTILLMVAHVVCFAVIEVVVWEQYNTIKEMEHSGQAMDHMHRATSYAVAMDAMYRGQSSISDIYGVVNITAFHSGEIDKYAKLMEEEINGFELAHQGAFLGFKKLRRLQDIDGIPLRTIWETPMRVSKIWVDTQQSFETEINVTLWQLGNDWTSAAREIMANHKLINQTYNGTLQPSRDYFFIIQNGPAALYNSYKSLLDGMVDWAIYEDDKVSKILLILLCLEACFLVSLCVAYLVRLLSRVGQYRFSLYSTFLVVPTSFLRALASKKVIVGDEDEEDDDDDDEQAAAEANKAANAQTTGHPAAAGSLIGKMTSAAGAAGGHHHRRNSQTGPPPAAGSSFWGTVRSMFGSARTQQMSMHGKRLNKSPFDSMYLLLPFFIWAGLIIIVYAVSYYWLSTMAPPTTMINVLAFIKFRVSRSVFYAVQLCSQTDNNQKLLWQEQFPGRLKDWLEEWDVMVLGNEGTTNPHFARAESVLWRGMAHQTVLFRARDVCFRVPEKGACFNHTHFYYEVSNNGMGYMMRRCIEEFTILGNDALADINLSSRRLNYIWEVGLNDLTDAVDAEYTLYREIVESTLKMVETLHIVLLVLSILLSLFFVFFMVRPFMKRSQKESRRVAELLSQLPADLDVESMVMAVLQQAAWRQQTKAKQGSMHQSSLTAQTAGGADGVLGAADMAVLDADMKAAVNGKGQDDDASSMASSQ